MKTIAIASGKGGVGKSTVTTQLASILANNSYKVGIMDADIYGPCQHNLLAAEDYQAEVTSEQKIIPGYSKTHKIYYIAVNNLIENLDDTPMLWRAPMATRLIRDFIERVEWPDLDFLFIDLPPGTGDIQITIAQLAKLDGALIITTPQKVAYNIAAKAIQMFHKVNVPILGIIENMSGYICTNCNHKNHIFSSNNQNSQGGDFLARKYNTELLGAIPLEHNLVTLSDSGQSVINLENNNPAKISYLKLTEQLLIKLALTKNNNNTNIHYKLTDNNILEIVDVNTNTIKNIASYDLRLNCPCDLCKEETSGRNLINKNLIAKDIKIINVHQVGNYGLRLTFSDGHNTGIYTTSTLYHN
jgi:ATP-binding protein involved in chromosome partitioning